MYFEAEIKQKVKNMPPRKHFMKFLWILKSSNRFIVFFLKEKWANKL